METQYNREGVGYTVTRVLSISPEQDELIRRNRSRIFISTLNEGFIDSVLFQEQRPVDAYISAVLRAIAYSGMKIEGHEIQIRSAFDAKVTGGLLQQHLVTNGWLEDEDGKVYDLIVELEPSIPEQLVDPDGIVSYSGQMIEGMEFENPLCFKLGVENLAPIGMDPESEDSIPRPQHEPEVTGKKVPGRVVNPETDRRLKENRERPQQLVSARQVQDRDDHSDNQSGRMAGSPGRVKNPLLDGRLSANRRRQAVSADSGR